MNNNYNNNNNNNDDIINNNKNEILFWKVFHNKFLLFTIFQKIETIGENSVGEKMKFQDIKSLNWIIKNKQFSLLKCKLEAGEDIEITEESLLMIIKSYTALLEKELNRVYAPTQDQYFTGEDGYKIGDEFIDNSFEWESKKLNEIKIGKLNLKQSFQLLLKYKSNQILEFKLIDYILKDNFQVEYSNEILDLLLCEPNSFKPIIYSSTIMEAIKHSTPLILEKLLNLIDTNNNNNNNNNNINNIINEKVKNYSVSASIKNVNHKESMLKFILNSNNIILYNIPNSNSNSNKRSKLNSTEIIQVSSSDNVDKIDVLEIFSIESTEIIYKLLDLNYLKHGFRLPANYKYTSIDYIIDCNYNLELLDNDTDLTNEEKYEKLFLTYSNFFESVYMKYLIKYDKPINGCDDMVVLDYTLNSKSTNGLIYLLSKDEESLEDLNSQFKESIDEQGILNSKEFTMESLKFIELYCKGYKYFGNCFSDKQILKFITGIKSNQEYELILKSIMLHTNDIKTGSTCNTLHVKSKNNNKSLFELIPTTWSTLSISPYLQSIIKDGTGSIVIEDTDTIDLMYKDYKYLQLALNKKEISFKFETIQLIQYAKTKYGKTFFKSSYSEDEEEEGENYDGGDDDDEKEENDGSEDDENEEYKKKEFEINSAYYRYPFTRAINKFDIESLKEIDSKGIKISYFQGCKVIENQKYSKQVIEKIKEATKIKGYSEKYRIDFDIKPTITTTQINQLLNYFNTTGYKSFQSDLLMDFIICLSKLPLTNSFNNNIDISKLKISFNQFPKLSIDLILFSITENINSNLVLLVLNNFNPFSTIELINYSIKEWESYQNELFDSSYYFYNEYQQIINLTQTGLYYKENFKNVLPKVCRSYESFQDTISIIKLLLNNLLTNNQLLSNYQIKIKLLEFNQELINYLFRRLLKIINIDIDIIISIHNFIKSSWLLISPDKEFQFQHTLYHIFFYLDIKSKQFTNYILSLKSSTTVFGNRNQKTLRFDNENFQFEKSDYYSSTTTTTTSPKDPFKLLNPDIFSFNFIINSTIQQVYHKLITTLKN